MRASTDKLTVSGIVHREKIIDPSPPYQRGPVWTRKQKQLLMDTILREYDIPKIYLRCMEKGSDHEYHVVDGQQRLRAIWEFRRGEYHLDKDMDEILYKGKSYDVAGKFYNELPYELKDIFDQYNLTISFLTDATREEVEDMFLRLQSGTPLNAPEKRNAISGDMRDFIHNVLANHNFISVSCNFKNKRYAYDAVAAQMMLIELIGIPCNVKGRDLEKMYKEKKDFDTDSDKAKKVLRVLNFLYSAFPQNDPTTDITKSKAVSLYMIISHLIERYAIKNMEADFGSWFSSFEKKRAMDELKPEDERNPHWVEYQYKTSYSTDGFDSLNYRKGFLLNEFLSAFSKLELLDDQRIFTPEQRKVIYIKDNGICQSCRKEVAWDNYEADHKISWINAGKTTVDNGQVLCLECNRKKGAKTTSTTT